MPANPSGERLEAIGLALAGRAGVGLIPILAVPTGTNALLRLIRTRPDAPLGRPRGNGKITMVRVVFDARPVNAPPGR
jgi:hypothetical protein